MPGATAFAIDSDAIYWIAPATDAGSGSNTSGVWRMEPGKRAVQLWNADVGVHGLALDQTANPPNVVWIDKRGGLSLISEDGNIPGVMATAMGLAAAVVAGPGRLDYSQHRDNGWHVHDFYDEFPDPVADRRRRSGARRGLRCRHRHVDDAVPGSKLATPVDGGVRALAVDDDDVFFGNTSIFEKVGRGPVNKLGPAGGLVTAMAVDGTFVYWATASGDRDPAIYRARRARPELELFTRVGSASQLIVAGAYLYWLDPIEGAIHRIKRTRD